MRRFSNVFLLSTKNDHVHIRIANDNPCQCKVEFRGRVVAAARGVNEYSAVAHAYIMARRLSQNISLPYGYMLWNNRLKKIK